MDFDPLWTAVMNASMLLSDVRGSFRFEQGAENLPLRLATGAHAHRAVLSQPAQNPHPYADILCSVHLCLHPMGVP